MKARIGVIAVVGVLVMSALWYWHGRGENPRRACLEVAQQVEVALHTGNHSDLLDLLELPASIQNRTKVEQGEFLAKALRDEISPEGLAVLKRHGQFGPLKEIFPIEADVWATQAGVDLPNCVALRLERNGFRAEVVLAKQAARAISGIRLPESGIRYRILRSRSQIVTLKRGQNIKYRPYAFTEQGVAMLSSVLRSERAVNVNIQIMRAFVRLRQLLLSHADLARKLASLEKKYDAQFRGVFDALRKAVVQSLESRREIGFHILNNPSAIQAQP